METVNGILRDRVLRDRVEADRVPDLKGLKLDGYGFRRTRSDKHWFEARTFIWGHTIHIAIPQGGARPKNAGIHIYYWENERVEQGWNNYKQYWNNLDPLVAQCVLFELLREVSDAT